jgi:hypothetical protein
MAGAWRGRVAARRVLAVVAACERCGAMFVRPEGEAWNVRPLSWGARRKFSSPLNSPRPHKVLVEYAVGAPGVVDSNPAGGAKFSRAYGHASPFRLGR